MRFRAAQCEAPGRAPAARRTRGKPSAVRVQCTRPAAAVLMNRVAQSAETAPPHRQQVSSQRQRSLQRTMGHASRRWMWRRHVHDGRRAPIRSERSGGGRSHGIFAIMRSDIASSTVTCRPSDVTSERAPVRRPCGLCLPVRAHSTRSNTVQQRAVEARRPRPGLRSRRTGACPSCG